jgi:hypothetical protein
MLDLALRRAQPAGVGHEPYTPPMTNRNLRLFIETGARLWINKAVRSPSRTGSMTPATAPYRSRSAQGDACYRNDWFRSCRIALWPGEVDALPDNLTQAVGAGMFLKTFDPKDPKQAFLPTDLLDKNGSWVAVSNLSRANEDFLAAPGHVRFTRRRPVSPICRAASRRPQSASAFGEARQCGAHLAKW